MAPCGFAVSLLLFVENSAECGYLFTELCDMMPDKPATMMFIAVRILNLVQQNINLSFLKGADYKCRKITVAGKALNVWEI